ncbi:hypothetical protein F5882DRAFT_441611 [Hyaloscypha sp. PMI_1271]|nr:hypothetical protein F5882DRAFT_441611 [Hyaloscypha sp. PMI_1271]
MTSHRMNTLAVPSNLLLRNFTSSTTSNADSAILLAGKPELQRAIAVYNYHDPNKRGFEFDVGDEISVRDYCDNNRWLGVNVNKNSIGIFPPSHVQEKLQSPGLAKDGIPIDKELQAVILDNEDGLITTLLEQFHQQYPPNTKPKAAFDIIRNLKSVDRDDFWLCFRLAYPEAALCATKLQNELQSLYDVFFRTRSARLNLSTCSASNRHWSFSNHLFYPDHYRQWTRWNDVKAQVHNSIASSAEAWGAFRHLVLAIRDPIPGFEDMVERLDALIGLLQTQLVRMEERVRESLQRDGDVVREEEHKRWEHEDDLKLGILKTSSWSSGIATASPLGKVTSRRLRRLSQKTSNPNITITQPLEQRMRVKWRQTWNMIQKQWKATLHSMGKTPAVLGIVILLSISSAATTGVSTWQCTPPEKIPTIDSNFWSTLSSAAMGIAGLYCTMIPILLEQEITVEHQKLFRWLLFSSLITGVSAAIVYPFQTRASLVLLSISGYAQLATTLQLILGAVTTIKEDSMKIEEQNGEISDLKDRLDR